MDIWQEHKLVTHDGNILWFESGSGPLIIFLHGGPGDEHRSLRPLAEPLTSHFRCVLYDQRGSGGSTLFQQDANTLHPDRFVEDLEQLRIELQTDKLNLVGHSWGAALALLYGIAHSDQVGQQALIGLGPINEEMASVARANRLKPLSQAEREEYGRLSAERQTAIKAGDNQRVTEINRRRIRLQFRGVFYHQDRLDELVENWLQYETYRNWRVNAILLDLLDPQAFWDGLSKIHTPTLAIYGYQDFEPITQAYILKERMSNVQVHFINECGHVPWLDQPEAIFNALFDFFRNLIV